MRWPGLRPRGFVRALAILLGIAAAATLPVRDAAAAPAAHPRLLLTAQRLAALRTRAANGDADWQALRAVCDGYDGATPKAFDSNDPPGDSGPGSAMRSDQSGPQIGPEYRGWGYFQPVVSLALCAVVLRTSDAAAAASYAHTAIGAMRAASTPPGEPGAPDPNNGYGIRTVVPMLAIGFDWLYDDLSADDRERIVAAINRWVDAYESSGFEAEFPQGNFFAGYYDAKALDALATEGDNSDPSSAWTGGGDAFLDHTHNAMVQPYYALNLAGGGWPEGWQYGPFSVVGMSLPALAAQSAKGYDLVQRKGPHPYLYPVANAALLPYLLWPDMQTLEDSDWVDASGTRDPTRIARWLLPFETGVLEQLHDPAAPVLQSFTAAEDALQSDHPDDGDGPAGPWMRFLFWDPAAPRSDYHALPLSHYAPGIEDLVTRSSWRDDAVWSLLRGGPYVNYPDNGEEFDDKGALVVVNGALPFLVNAWTALQRDTPGFDPATGGDGNRYGDPLYADLFGGGGRTVFNVFYAADPAGPGQVGLLRRETAGFAGGNTAQMSGYEDGGSYVVVRDGGLEQNYPTYGEQPVRSWTRDVTYLRPGVFVVFDRTTVADAGHDRWMAWHLPSDPLAGEVLGQSPGVRRYDINSHDLDTPTLRYAGTVDTVLPAAHDDRVVDLFKDAPDCGTGTPADCGGKVFRLETRPHAPSADGERWLTVFDAEPRSQDAYHATQLVPAPAGAVGVQSGPLLGVLLGAAGAHTRNLAVLGGSGDLSTLPVTGPVTFTVPDADTDVLVRDLPAGAPYAVTLARSAGMVAVTLTPDSAGDTRTTPAGVLLVPVGSATGGSAGDDGGSGAPSGPGSGGAGGSSTAGSTPAAAPTATTGGPPPASASAGPRIFVPARLRRSALRAGLLVTVTGVLPGSHVRVTVLLAGRRVGAVLIRGGADQYATARVHVTGTALRSHAAALRVVLRFSAADGRRITTTATVRLRG